MPFAKNSYKTITKLRLATVNQRRFTFNGDKNSKILRYSPKRTNCAYYYTAIIGPKKHNGLEFKPKIKKEIMSELDIQKWLSNITETIKTKDIKKHMELVSKNVAVYGLPNGKTLNYADWKKRRQSEFKRGLINSIQYNKLSIKNFGLRRLTFKIEEITDGSCNELLVVNKEIILEHEQDNQWRVVEETIKNWKFLISRKLE